MGDVDAVTWPLTRPVGPLSVLPSRARRCLFGSVDHNKVKIRLEDEIEKILGESKLRWNFDFEAGKPLPAGQYKWEVVNQKDADSNGESPPTAEVEVPSNCERQTQITDFLRKRKSSNQKESATSQKTRRRSST